MGRTSTLPKRLLTLPQAGMMKAAPAALSLALSATVAMAQDSKQMTPEQARAPQLAGHSAIGGIDGVVLPTGIRGLVTRLLKR